MIAWIKRWLRRNSPPQVPESLWQRVERDLPCLRHLDSEERRALRIMALDFLDRKVFSGAHGFEPNNVVRLSIALQACLLVLKLGLHAYDGWNGIIVYPGEFVIPQRRVDAAGVTHEFHQQALGQAWQDGPVLIAHQAMAALGEGANVVIHEFAHKLDMLNGKADGRPPLPTGVSAAQWSQAFSSAFSDFCYRVSVGEPSFMGAYAAEHPAEFFAMCCESFFCQPEALHQHYPSVYQLLTAYFRQNPLSRQ